MNCPFKVGDEVVVVRLLRRSDNLWIDDDEGYHGCYHIGLQGVVIGIADNYPNTIILDDGDYGDWYVRIEELDFVTPPIKGLFGEPYRGD